MNLLIKNAKEERPFLPEASMLAYIKEKLNISMNSYTELRLWAEMDNILPNRKEIENIVEYFNIKTWNKMEIRKIGNGFICSIKALVHFIVICHIKEQRTREELNVPYVMNIPDILHFKVSLDSRTIEGDKSTVLSIVPLNLQTFSPQKGIPMF